MTPGSGMTMSGAAIPGLSSAPIVTPCGVTPMPGRPARAARPPVQTVSAPGQLRCLRRFLRARPGRSRLRGRQARRARQLWPARRIPRRRHRSSRGQAPLPCLRRLHADGGTGGAPARTPPAAGGQPAIVPGLRPLTGAPAPAPDATPDREAAPDREAGASRPARFLQARGQALSRSQEVAAVRDRRHWRPAPDARPRMPG